MLGSALDNWPSGQERGEVHPSRKHGDAWTGTAELGQFEHVLGAGHDGSSRTPSEQPLEAPPGGRADHPALSATHNRAELRESLHAWRVKARCGQLGGDSVDPTVGVYH